MKKLIILLSMAALLMFTGMALAEDVETDGINIVNGDMVLIDTEGYADNQAPRNFTPGVAFDPQGVSVKLHTHAALPCHLEMQFEGNDENVTLNSFGPGAFDTYNSANYIAFHPELTGFVGEDWQYIAGSTDMNAEIEPADDVYIRGCDTFRTTMWANVSYKYSISCAGLNGNGLNLPVDMRAAIFDTDPGFTAVDGSDPGDYGVELTFSSSNSDQDVIASIPALQGKVVYQQFRVPFSRDYKGGYYSGDITFTAATI